MTENMKAFLKLTHEDKELQNQLHLLNQEPKDDAVKAVLDLARQKGIPLSEEDIASAPAMGAELEDGRLDAVSGGLALEDDQRAEASVFVDPKDSADSIGFEAGFKAGFEAGFKPNKAGFKAGFEAGFEPKKRGF